VECKPQFAITLDEMSLISLNQLHLEVLHTCETLSLVREYLKLAIWFASIFPSRKFWRLFRKSGAAAMLWMLEQLWMWPLQKHNLVESFSNVINALLYVISEDASEAEYRTPGCIQGQM